METIVDEWQLMTEKTVTPEGINNVDISDIASALYPNGDQIGSSNGSDAGNAQEYTDEELEALYSQAHQLHHSGMQAKAHDLFFFIANCRPGSPRYCKALGVSLMSAGNYEAAVPILAVALLHDGGTDLALPVACAECLALTGRRPLARRLFEQANTMLRLRQNPPGCDRLIAHTEAWLKILKEQ